jgi:hypothetical protein
VVIARSTNRMEFDLQIKENRSMKRILKMLKAGAIVTEGTGKHKRATLIKAQPGIDSIMIFGSIRSFFHLIAGFLDRFVDLFSGALHRPFPIASGQSTEHENARHRGEHEFFHYGHLYSPFTL